MAAPAEQYDLLPQSAQHQRPPHAQQPLHQQNQQQPKSQTKPRSFSVRSDKSHRSGGTKSDFHETHEEKESKRLHTKADPSLAINEAEPSTVAMMTQSNHAPLRSLQHKDVWGNPITDPDKSNPTRNRWERPLDTIRSFEAAIDGGYSRKTLSRSETDTSGNWNQRSGTQQPQNQPRFPQDNYYGNANRPTSIRTEQHYANSTTARSSYMDPQQGYAGGYGAGYGGRHAPRDRAPRTHHDQHYQTQGREQGVYPLPHKDRSYETVTSAANSDPAGYQTDPTSSDNSSVDRVSPAKGHEPANDYGIGFSQSGNHYQTSNYSVSRRPNHPNQSLPPLPAEPRHYDAVPAKKPLPQQRQVSPPQQDGPRKSWFSRRFSRDA